MVVRVKEKLKNLWKNRQSNHFRYQRFDKNKSKMTEVKRKSFGKTIGNIIHRFVAIIVRFIFKNFIYGEKGNKVAPIKNLLLLDPANTLAMKIRTKKATSVEVMKAFIERIQVVKN
jgi:fatty acid amide hydrolase 2